MVGLRARHITSSEVSDIAFSGIIQNSILALGIWEREHYRRLVLGAWDPIFLRLRSRRVLVLGGNLRTSPLRRLAMQCLQVRAALVCLRTPVRGRKCQEVETGV